MKYPRFTTQNILISEVIELPNDISIEIKSIYDNIYDSYIAFHPLFQATIYDTNTDVIHIDYTFSICLPPI